MSEVKKDPDIERLKPKGIPRTVREIEAEEAKIAKRLSEIRAEKARSTKY